MMLKFPKAFKHAVASDYVADVIPISTVYPSIQQLRAHSMQYSTYAYPIEQLKVCTIYNLTTKFERNLIIFPWMHLLQIINVYL